MIHRNKVPSPALARPAARLYSLEAGDSEAVVGAAFRLAVGLVRGRMLGASEEREPTPDEAEGMAWWNALTECERASVCAEAGTAVPAVAWEWFKSGGAYAKSTP